MLSWCGTGTLTGAGSVKEKYPNIQIVAIEPEDSAILSGNPDHINYKV